MLKLFFFYKSISFACHSPIHLIYTITFGNVTLFAVLFLLSQYCLYNLKGRMVVVLLGHWKWGRGNHYWSEIVVLRLQFPDFSNSCFPVTPEGGMGGEGVELSTDKWQVFSEVDQAHTSKTIQHTHRHPVKGHPKSTASLSVAGQTQSKHSFLLLHKVRPRPVTGQYLLNTGRGRRGWGPGLRREGSMTSSFSCGLPLLIKEERPPILTNTDTWSIALGLIQDITEVNNPQHTDVSSSFSAYSIIKSIWPKKDSWSAIDLPSNGYAVRMSWKMQRHLRKQQCHSTSSFTKTQSPMSLFLPNPKLSGSSQWAWILARGIQCMLDTHYPENANPQDH